MYLDQINAQKSERLKRRNFFLPLLPGRPRNDDFLVDIGVDEVDLGQLVDGEMHFADRKPVQLELNLDLDLLVLLQVPRVDQEVGQPRAVM